MKTFMLNTLDAPENMQPRLDSIVLIRNWYRYMPGCYILVAEDQTTAQQLAMSIRSRAEGVWFVVAEIFSVAADGYLPGAAWTFLNNPRDSGRHGTPALRSMENLLTGGGNISGGIMGGASSDKDSLF
ncbi:MAG TPA: hypothetical protein VFG49_12565 [Dyella sp.]|uniref:hypothetical protein n=1 Tax=Dyella sp. TaxID=1869338 RepID=UPI002D79D8E0|nr:hypothetical protein [Dyella sp.]HET6554360.1 hypothetical protein [Dyella sp.]